MHLSFDCIFLTLTVLFVIGSAYTYTERFVKVVTLVFIPVLCTARCV